MSRRPSPERRTFEVLEAQGRLDRYLAGACPDLSRSQLQKLIQDGLVTVNSLSTRAAARLREGDEVQVILPPDDANTLAPEDIDFEVIYEDDDVAVIDKPAGLTVHPAPSQRSHTLVNALIRRFPDMAAWGDSLRPGIVHRLDKDTSGLMVIARNERARVELIEQFKSHSVKKCYAALAKGKLVPGTGSIEAPIGRDPGNRKRMAIVSKGKEARTDYRVLEYLSGYSLVEACIQTGRTHQIRVHFSAIGHPLLGDRTYGGKSSMLDRQFLHASSLELSLPSTGLRHLFSSDLPEDLKRVLRDLGHR
jgi:23S rRNA pseudouridine1911/1915/1917 synthase